MTLKRRDLLKFSLGAYFVSLTGLAKSVKATRKKKPQVGIQLYAVRKLFSEDPEGTLKAVAKLGYEGVEFWGYGGGPYLFRNKTADQFRKVLDDLGIKCCGIHLSYKALQGKRLKQTIEVNKKLGNRFLIVAAAGKEMRSPETIKKFAKELNALSKILKKEGMYVGYHSHGFDFRKLGKRTAWELLFSQTSPEVIMQLDFGNCAGGGGDPVKILKEFPGRAKSVHVKDWPKAPLKKGSEVWEEIFELCLRLHKTQWFVVEQGERAGNDLEIPKKSIEIVKSYLS